MNIPRSESLSLFGLNTADFTAEKVITHLVADAAVSGSYLLLLAAIVYLNHRKYISIFVPKRTYLATFGLVFLLTFGMSLLSLLGAATETYLIYKIMMATLIVAVVVGIWRILPRDIDPFEKHRMYRESVTLKQAEEHHRAADVALIEARAEVDNRVAERTAELSAVNLALEKEVIERRLAEERAVEAKRRVDELIMRTNTAMVFADNDGTVLECNHALAQLLGRSTIEELLDRKLGRLVGLKDAGPLAHFFNETLRHGSFAGELEVAPPARGVLHVEINAIASVQNNRPCLMVLLRDVSERKAAERELLKSREALATALEVTRKANAARSDFLAKMNHELRTPLNGIIGLSEILRHKASGRSVPGGEVRKLAGNIHQSGRHLLSVVDDLLDISRLDAGNRELSPVGVAVRSEIDSAILTLETIASKKNIKITNTCDPKIEWIIDQRAFKQIIINLVNNAVKFSPTSTEVRIDVTATDNAMSVHIHDQGPGVSDSDKERILAPFGRGEYARANKIDGVGLGLTIVTELLKLQGGTITIDSEMGNGSTFTASFPGRGSSSGEIPSDRAGRATRAN